MCPNAHRLSLFVLVSSMLAEGEHRTRRYWLADGILKVSLDVCTVALIAPLRIEAREPTRKETVKVRHRRIRKKVRTESRN